MALGNFAGNLASALQGQREYSDWQQQKELKAAQLKAYQQQQQLGQEDIARNKDIARGYLALLQQPQEVIPPMPGQASIPTQQALPRAQIKQGQGPLSENKQGATEGVPLGLRQNNPGNLRRWGDMPTKNGFAVFPTPEAGLQAMRRQLQLYGQRGANTIEKIISTWAPPSENNTRAYIDQVSRSLGVSPQTPLDLNNPSIMKNLMQAMVRQEQGNAAGSAFVQQMENKRQAQFPPGQQPLPVKGQQPPPSTIQLPPRAQQAGNLPQETIPSLPKENWESAIQRLAAQGIRDPQAIAAILDKRQARLDIDARNTLALLREQDLGKSREEAISEKARHNLEMEKLGGINAETRRQANSPVAGSLDEKAIDFAARQAIITEKLPPLGMGRSAAVDRARILNRIAEMDVSPQDIQANKFEIKALGFSLVKLQQFSAMAGNFEKTAIKNAELALSLASGGAGTQYPTINAWINAVRRGVGKGDIVAFQNALDTFKLEYAKIMSGATGAAGITVKAWEHADKLINIDMSPEQLRDAIETAKAEMINRKDSVTQEIKDVKGSLREVGKLPRKDSDVGVAAYSDPEKEKRYQEWKKTHGK